MAAAAGALAPLVEDAQAAGGYHCIVLDPPWENASAKRSARYPTLPSRNLLGLPLRQLMCQGGCLVAMWITNRERHRRFIDSELLPGWGLRHLATWHWLKVTDHGQLVSRLDIEHRRPYESLLLCWPAHLPPPPGLPDSGQQLHGSSGGEQATAAAAAAAGGQPAGRIAPGRQAAGLLAAGGQAGPSNQSAPDAAANGFHLLQDLPLVIAAVPPAAHSRKPHLGPLLLPLLPPGARCLEMFARELHSGWTSWGNEALKFQSTACFEPAVATE
ncbi:methyltransferase 2 [Chlorella sorokiniana]|uniref:Methyltransferase 2 n=1 Tax=Chlorella sorokiniana TaxID=3076 RepID=A0A2P6TGR6_CHLSO|nr:methyltransferase 2 [Chlorella sorokiniana]|eukprot:PRW33311.1 methyltransferase 2 [Chlorella sorokiniana]